MFYVLGFFESIDSCYYLYGFFDLSLFLQDVSRDD